MTMLRSVPRPLAIALLIALPVSPRVASQGLDPAALLKPASDSWPTYHGDYTGQRHSRLTQITPVNVHQMTLAWAFQTGQTQQIKATPILVNGVIYVTTPDNLWAIDARSGRQIWRYTYPANDGFHIGHRGVAVYKDFVYLTTPDAHLIALDARDGKVKWNIVIADAKRGYWSTNAPLVIRNHLIVGVSGDFDNLPGILRSFDAETGKPQWTFHSTPPPGTPGSISGGATGGQMWMTGTYDPELNLLYVGTGNPTPVLNGAMRPGDNRWTGSIVALNPDTGALAWGFQVSPHDTHDWDAAEVPVLVDRDFGGQPRKLLLQASRNGYYFVLDRTNGKNLLTAPFATVNWAKEIDKEGRPIPNPDKEPARDGRLVAPDVAGGTNYRSPRCDRSAGGQRPRRVRPLFLQARARRVRLGGRKSSRVRPRRAQGHRLSDRTNPVEPRPPRRGRRRRCADDGIGSDLHRRFRRQRARPAHERRHDPVALRRRARRQLADHVRARREAVRGRRRRERAVCIRARGAVGLPSHDEVAHDDGCARVGGARTARSPVGGRLFSPAASREVGRGGVLRRRAAQGTEAHETAGRARPPRELGARARLRMRRRPPDIAAR
jgi:alcohol dehydrogenase (cytochrome c)